jgi:hypothetical protein
MYTINYVIDDNKKLSVSNASPVINGENNVTTISVKFPPDYSTWQQYVIFKTKTSVDVGGGLISTNTVLLTLGKYILTSGLVDAEIQNIQFKAISPTGAIFKSTILNFPVLQPSFS